MNSDPTKDVAGSSAKQLNVSDGQWRGAIVAPMASVASTFIVGYESCNSLSENCSLLVLSSMQLIN